MEETDYDLLRWFIEKIGVKLDVSDTADYKIIGPPDLLKHKEVEAKIEEAEVKGTTQFGLPEGEFENES